MNRADNQRGRDTQARIESAFLVLLAQKEPNKITIREICDGAQISRTAFYKHYEDIYDLLRKVGQKFMMQSRAFFTDGTQQGENYTRQAYLQYFDFISQNRTFFLYFFRQGGTAPCDVFFPKG